MALFFLFFHFYMLQNLFSKSTSSTFNDIISVTLIPVAYANSSIALSLVPFKSTFFGWSNNNATSLDVNTLGTLFSIFGDEIPSVGSFSTSLFLTPYW